MTKQYTNTREPGEFGDGVTVEKMTDDELVEKLRTVNIATAPYACPEAVDWCHEAAGRLSALSPRVVSDEPPLTCPHIDKAIASGELSDDVVAELHTIRDINSQLRHSTWALRAQLESALSSAGEKEDEVALGWKCPECGCTGYAHVDEQKADGSFNHGPLVRRVNCKITMERPSPHPTSADKLEVVGYVKEGDYRASGFEYISERSIDVLCVPLVRHSDATRIITTCQQEVERLRGERKGMVHEVAYRHAVARAETAEARNAELVKALEEIASDDERGDYEGVVQFARAALRKG